MAKSVERHTRNVQVRGSIPRLGCNRNSLRSKELRGSFPEKGCCNLFAFTKVAHGWHIEPARRLLIRGLLCSLFPFFFGGTARIITSLSKTWKPGVTFRRSARKKPNTPTPFARRGPGSATAFLKKTGRLILKRWPCAIRSAAPTYRLPTPNSL